MKNTELKQIEQEEEKIFWQRQNRADLILWLGVGIPLFVIFIVGMFGFSLLEKGIKLPILLNNLFAMIPMIGVPIIVAVVIWYVFLSNEHPENIVYRNPKRFK